MKKEYNHIPDHVKIMATEIISLVSDIFSVKKEEILSNRRHEHIIVARAACIALLRKVERIGPSDAAGIFHKDHSSAIHAIKVHHNSYDTDYNNYCDKYEKCLSLYLLSKEKKHEEVNDSISLGILAMEKKIERIQEMKRKLVDCKMSNKKIDSDLLNKISQEMPPEVTLSLYESNISLGINLKEKKNEVEDQPVDD